jgi:hypothetical protein
MHSFGLRILVSARQGGFPVAITFSIYTPGGWLDVPGSSQESGIQVHIWSDLHGGDNQQWFLRPSPTPDVEPIPSYQIQSRVNNLLLTLDGGRTDERTPVVQIEDVGDDAQLWVFDWNSEIDCGLTFSIIPKLLYPQQRAIVPGLNGIEIRFPAAAEGDTYGQWLVAAVDFAAPDTPPRHAGQQQ